MPLYNPLRLTEMLKQCGESRLGYQDIEMLSDATKIIAPAGASNVSFYLPLPNYSPPPKKKVN